MKFNVDDFHFCKSFGELKDGEVFYTEASGTLWMKLRENDFLYNSLYNSAVALDNGTVCSFKNDDDVIKVDIECKITLSN